MFKTALQMVTHPVVLGDYIAIVGLVVGTCGLIWLIPQYLK